MASHARIAASTTPDSTASITPIRRGAVIPKTVTPSLSPNVAMATEPIAKPANAPVSIMPSMPMLTTPERSFMKPHMAPRAMGVAAPMMVGAMIGRTSMR